ncbi:MAG: hypothetical protein ABSF35_18145 [Polyangia bacterium]|jgi:hypothetical protein
MEAIDRCVLIVKPKQAYVVWANGLPDADSGPEAKALVTGRPPGG